MLNVERSLQAAQTVPIERKACWSNAFYAFIANKELHTGHYVEGWAIPDMEGMRLNVEHGWIETEDGSVIDPTFAVQGHKNVEYFPALKLTYQDALNLVRQKATLPHIRSFGSGGMAHPAYREAYTLSSHSAFGIQPPPPTKK